MEFRSQWLWALVLMQVLAVRNSCGLSVHFPSQQPIYVVSGQDLVLQAQIDLPPGDRVTKVIWEHEAGKRASGKMTVAEFPTSTSSGRVSVDKGGAMVKIQNYQRGDSGVYTVTVTDQRGGQGSGYCTVEDYEAVRHVSVMVNVSHSSLHCQEAWGTDPVFTWLHEKVLVTTAVGRTSPDGSDLFLAGPLCGHFTCVVGNKLGHSSATYTAEPCEQESRGSALAVVCLIILVLVAGGLAFLLWRKHGRYNSRMERLQESYEDTI